jgi:hypothetical protein
MAWYEPTFFWRPDAAEIAEIFTVFPFIWFYLVLFAFICGEPGRVAKALKSAGVVPASLGLDRPFMEGV